MRFPKGGGGGGGGGVKELDDGTDEIPARKGSRGREVTSKDPTEILGTCGGGGGGEGGDGGGGTKEEDGGWFEMPARKGSGGRAMR